MSLQAAWEEYAEAVRRGKKEVSERSAAGLNTEPIVLDTAVEGVDRLAVRELGVMEIPAERIVGVKSIGRAGAFSASFLPLMPADTEFAHKWATLCAAHLGDTGITQPIECWEYLGNFYVQEGNKRVSVLRYFGAARIEANVKRILPERGEDARIQAYYEFLDFFKQTRLYCIQFRRPRDYAQLLSDLGKAADEAWTEDERRRFEARFHTFRLAVEAVNTRHVDILPEEVLLLWLQLYSFDKLGEMSDAELKKSVAALWNDAVSVQGSTVELATRVEEEKPNLISRIISAKLDYLNVALVQQLTPATSGWAQGHERGMAELVQALGERISVRRYENINTPEEEEAALDEAVADGAQVVFTTVPQMANATLRAAVKYPEVFFFNCSVDSAYSSIRTYYGRVYEGKFITGAIAGAMAENNRIGYIASYPIYGVPASINAFALGAQMTNPRVKIELRWACMDGSPQADFFAKGIRVVSNRDVPVASKTYLNFCNYGTYWLDEQAELVPLASPVWAWGSFYRQVAEGILSGTLKKDRSAPARNYWLGMDTGVIDLDLSDKLPDGIRQLALTLQHAIASGALHVFDRRLIDQSGTVRSGGGRLSMEELVHMDWLCENVEGRLPHFDELTENAKNIVRELGVYKEEIPLAKGETT